MASPRRAVLIIAICTALTASACGDPPNKELQQAQHAIDAARAAGADRYAGEEFAAAEAALKSANDAVEQRDYRLALSRALDAEARAQSAASDAEARKTAARGDADRALKAATATITTVQTRLQTAEAAARTRPKVLTPVRRSLAAAERSLQEARTAYGQGDYLAARETARAASSRLSEATRDLDAISPPPARRRR